MTGQHWPRLGEYAERAVGISHSAGAHTHTHTRTRRTETYPDAHVHGEGVGGGGGVVAGRRATALLCQANDVEQRGLLFCCFCVRGRGGGEGGG